MPRSLPCIRAWHIVISGFTQTRGRMTGMMQLALKLGAEHRDAHTAVELHEWNCDWAQLAEYIWLTRPVDQDPKVFIYAYSWGSGWGFTQLARELLEREVPIECAVLSDPVYRSRWLSFAWRSLIGKPLIYVPPNVREVYSFRQNANRPCGHELTAENPDRTTIHPARLVDDGTIHQYMDDHRPFHDLCLVIARNAKTSAAA